MKTSFQYDSAGAYIQKDPADVLDYSNDWTDWLAQTAGDTISTSTWTPATGITAATPTIAAGITTVFLSGGAAGTSYKIDNRIVTAQGRICERSFRLVVAEQ